RGARRGGVPRWVVLRGAVLRGAVLRWVVLRWATCRLSIIWRWVARQCSRWANYPLPQRVAVHRVSHPPPDCRVSGRAALRRVSRKAGPAACQAGLGELLAPT